MKLNSPEFDQALQKMGHSVQELRQRLDGAQNAQDLLTRLQAFKDDVRRSYRRAMARLHPDRPGGDEDAFKEVSVAAEMVANLKIGQRPQPRPQPRPQRVRMVRVFFGGGFSGFTDSSTTGTTTIFSHAPHVVFRRGGGGTGSSGTT